MFDDIFNVSFEDLCLVLTSQQVSSVGYLCSALFSLTQWPHRGNRMYLMELDTCQHVSVEWRTSVSPPCAEDKCVSLWICAFTTPTARSQPKFSFSCLEGLHELLATLPSQLQSHVGRAEDNVFLQDMFGVRSFHALIKVNQHCAKVGNVWRPMLYLARCSLIALLLLASNGCNVSSCFKWNVAH